MSADDPRARARARIGLSFIIPSAVRLAVFIVAA